MVSDGDRPRPMQDVGPLEPKIADPLLQRLYLHWKEKRGTRAMPSRGDIDPVEVRFIIGHLMLLDVVPPDDRFHIRLQGVELDSWIGRKLTGMTLDSQPSSQLRALAQVFLTSVVQSRSPFHRVGAHTIDGTPRNYEVLILPLSTDDHSVDVVLAAVRCR